jgi:hypothetical protein
VSGLVDFCLQFLYFILNYSFLVINSTGVGISILSNFTNSFNHFVIEEYQKLPSYVLEIKENYDEHQENFGLYWKEHECLGCRICIVENHSDCNNVAIMETIIKNVKTSTMFTEVEYMINEMIETISKIRQNRYMQILQPRHSCSLQYKPNFSWCSS